MKHLWLLILLFTTVQVQFLKAQEQEVDARFYYQVSGLVYAYKFDYTDQTQSDYYKIPKPGLKFKIVRKGTNSVDDYEYYIIQFLPIIDDKIKIGKNKLI